MLPKFILALIFISFLISEGQACQCYSLNFCDYLKESAKKIAIEATVLHHKVYSQNDAVYLNVDKIYRDDVGISSIIKLYGKSGTGDCHVDVLKRFPDGVKVYLIVGLEYNGHDVTHGFTNPDAIYENYWEVAPFSCFMVLLNVKNDIVSGRISDKLYEYPLGLFEQHLETCDYSIEELNMFRCHQLPFKVYPNPSADGIINIGNEYYYTAIKRIRIYDISGRLLYDQSFILDPFQHASFDLKNAGLYIVEFQCEGSTLYEKVIII